MLGYQVINKDKYPAGGEFEDLAIFPTWQSASEWIDYLVNVVGDGTDKLQDYDIIHVYIERP